MVPDLKEWVFGWLEGGLCREEPMVSDVSEGIWQCDSVRDDDPRSM